MGVTGLWQILDSVGHPIKLDGLEGKRLAVDANIWLYKFIRANGQIDTDSHRIGLFNRIAKLLFYGIKPIFVFDGPAPQLKRRTLDKRQNIRHKHLEKVQIAAVKILAQQIKEKFPNANVDDLRISLPEFRSNGLVAAEKLTDDDMDMFRLPDIKQDVSESENSDADSDVVELDPDFQQFSYVSKVDINSADFEKLPAEIRYEMLQEIKLSKKRIRNVESLPDDSESFSKLQLERLKARRLIQEKIERSEKDICASYIGETGYHLVKRESFQDTWNQPSTSQVQERKVSPQPSQANQEKAPIQTREATPRFSDEHKEFGQSIIEQPVSEQENIEQKVSETESDTDSDMIEVEPIVQQHVSVPQADCSSNESLEFAPANMSNESEEEVEKEQEKAKETRQSGQHEEEPSGSQPQVVAQAQNVTVELSDSDESTYLSAAQTQVEAPSEKEHLHLPQQEDQSTRLQQTETNSTAQNVTVELSDSDESTYLSPKRTQQEEAPPEKERIIPNDTQRSQPTSQSTQVNSQVTSHQHVPPMVAQLSQTDRDNARHARKVTSKIIDEAKELLRLFGVPYMDAAGEAEAQCALLESLKLCDGTITDDSDIWLFGSKNVFRHFFSDDKYVLQYKMSEIEFHIRLTRENLICFAMLVGSDYTDGITNVGPVTALEILSEFKGDGIEPLEKFHVWWLEAKRDRTKANNKKLRTFLKFQLPEEFPSKLVYEGYLKPTADDSTDNFEWGTPELDELREYARMHFNWDQKRVDEKLLPVIKKINQKKIQRTIDTFFFRTEVSRNPELFRSKRVNSALNKIAAKSSGQDNEEEAKVGEEEEEEASNPKKLGRKTKVTKRTKAATATAKGTKRAGSKAGAAAAAKTRQRQAQGQRKAARRRPEDSDVVYLSESD